jgi:hypothetical protein
VVVSDEGMENKFYVVDEPLIPYLESIGFPTAPHTLYLTVTDKRVHTVIPVRCADESGERNAYNSTKEEVLLFGVDHWVRMFSDTKAGRYNRYPAPVGRFGEPVWAPFTPAKVFNLAIRKNGLLIDSRVHPRVLAWIAAEETKS